MGLPIKSNNLLPPRVYNQFSVGACVAFSIKTLTEIQMFYERGEWFIYSAGYLYHNMKYNQDIMAGIKAIRDYGVCEFSLFPYMGEESQLAPNYLRHKRKTEPMAMPQSIMDYGRLDKQEHILKAINKFHGVLCGINIPLGLHSAKGKIRANALTNLSNQYHEVVIPNYDTIDGKIYYQILNSWSSDWGNNGTLWVEATHPMFRDFHYIVPRTGVLREDIVQLEIPIGSTDITKIIDFTNYSKYTALQPAQIIKGTTVVPVRAVFEALGLKVTYDTTNKIVKATNYEGWNVNE